MLKIDPLASKTESRFKSTRQKQQHPIGTCHFPMTSTPRSCAMRAAPARAATDKKAPLRCGTNAQAAVWSENMPPMVKKLPKKPKDTPSPRRVRLTALQQFNSSQGRQQCEWRQRRRWLRDVRGVVQRRFTAGPVVRRHSSKSECALMYVTSVSRFVCACRWGPPLLTTAQRCSASPTRSTPSAP